MLVSIKLQILGVWGPWKLVESQIKKIFVSIFIIRSISYNSNSTIRDKVKFLETNLNNIWTIDILNIKKKNCAQIGHIIFYNNNFFPDKNVRTIIYVFL